MDRIIRLYFSAKLFYPRSHRQKVPLAVPFIERSAYIQQVTPCASIVGESARATNQGMDELSIGPLPMMQCAVWLWVFPPLCSALRERLPLGDSVAALRPGAKKAEYQVLPA